MIVFVFVFVFVFVVIVDLLVGMVIEDVVVFGNVGGGVLGVFCNVWLLNVRLEVVFKGIGDENLFIWVCVCGCGLCVFLCLLWRWVVLLRWGGIGRGVWVDIFDVCREEVVVVEVGEEDLGGRVGMVGVGMEVVSVIDLGRGSGGVEERVFGWLFLDFVYCVSVGVGLDNGDVYCFSGFGCVDFCMFVMKVLVVVGVGWVFLYFLVFCVVVSFSLEF